VPERKVVVTLGEREIQGLEQAILDEDRDAAMEWVRTVVKPQVDAQLTRGHCKPVFEWGQTPPEAVRPARVERAGGPPDIR
jgi:hypothetical protein